MRTVTTRAIASATRKPIAHRFLVLGLALLSLPAGAATWTLDSALERALSSASLDELADAAAVREHAEGAGAVPRHNPRVGYQREQSFGAGATGTAEDYLWLGQTIDPSFRRGLHEQAGERRAQAARYLVQERRRDVVVGLSSRYALALALERRVEAQRSWVSRLEELAARIRSREQAGDASRYDVLRIEREAALAQQHLDDADIERSRVRGELAAWLSDDPDSMTLTGELAPPAASASSVPRPPSALALDEEARALALENDAAGRWYLPPVTLSAGGKTVFAPDVAEVGYLFTAEVPLPLFEREQARRDELAAARRVSATEADLRAKKVERAAAAAVAEWSRALSALQAHKARAAGRSQALIDTARAAWSGGELSLLALLEAERTALDDDLTSTDLALRARLAQLHHAALTLEVSP